MLQATDAAPSEERLDAAARLLRHRGPDSQGVWATEGIGLVSTRLSLFDLSPRSDQPFWDPTRRYCLIYNGELYNHRELREELERDGVKFRTSGDTEVLLHYLVNRGDDESLLRLEGMFAFALYDTHEKLLTVARDRFGIKPLYVYDTDDVFIVSSEIRAMRPWVNFEPDLLSISAYLQGFAGPTTGNSFFQEIEIVPPGAVIRVRRGQEPRYSRFAHVSDFWDPNERERLASVPASAIVDSVEELLVDSVKTQLAADAPVGVFCSGGVDSSLVTAMAAQHHGNVAVFHADVVGRHSEREAAANLARHVGLELTVVEVRDEHLIDKLPEVIEHWGHPFSHHPESLPILMLSGLVRDNNVKAILTGEGADECYMGYPWRIFNLHAFIRRLPDVAFSGGRRLIKGLLREPEANVPQVHRWALDSRFEQEAEWEMIRRAITARDHATPSERELMSLNDLCQHLRRALHRSDCLGMAASVEARFPFLDTRLVKLAVNMPYRCKVRFSPLGFDNRHYFLTDKWVVRKIAERYLPRDLSQRKKQVLRVSAQARMMISDHFFDGSRLADVLHLSRSGMEYLLSTANQSLRVRLLQLEVWIHTCLDGASGAGIRRRLKDHVSIAPER